MNDKKRQAIIEARHLLRSKEKAILSTHSKSKSGYPFGSMTTFISDHVGHPIIYISNLAQHTHNIDHDPRMSIIVSQDNGNDINAGARLTLLGQAKAVENQEVESIGEKFYARFPESRKYQNTHDFKFYRIHVEHVRYIGGFGQIYWLPVEHFILEQPQWSAQEHYAIDHMNEGHIDAMQLMLSHFKKVDTEDVIMTHLYPDGCILKADHKDNYYLPYSEMAMASGDIRKRLVELTHHARQKLNA